MLHNKAIVIFALLCINFASESSASNWPSKSCLISRKCSDTEEVVWASNGSTCYVFRNQCYFENANCNLQNANMKGLKYEPKEECQKKCRKFCTADFTPVCGIYNNVKITFTNSCVMGNYICETGKTYSLYSNRACDSELPTVENELN